MTATASGSDNPRPTPITDHIHYAVSEDVHLELDQLFLALDAISELADGMASDQGADLESRHYAPIFRTFSYLGKRLMAEMPVVHPNRRAA